MENQIVPVGSPQAVTKLRADTPLSSVMRVLAAVRATARPNPIGEPVIVADPDVQPGVLSQAVLAAGLRLQGEARLTPRVIDRVFDLTPLPR